MVWWRYWKQSQRSLQRRTPKLCGFYIPKCKIMSTNTLSKETELRLTEFFNNSIDSKSMAKTIRQVNFLIALNAIREDGFMKTETINIEDGFFWLNELAEILDPYLGIE